MSRLKCTEPGAEELFMKLVEEHNAEFGNIRDSDDDLDNGEYMGEYEDTQT